jgi:hypothetical protein
MQSPRRPALFAFVLLLSACGFETFHLEPDVDVAMDEEALNGDPEGWDVKCEVSQNASFDPIVAPGVEPFGHLHTFFGTQPRPDSTLATMRAQTNTVKCGRPEDTSGYWIPALRRPDGSVVRPTHLSAYYRSFVNYRLVQFAPPDLRIIAGNKDATTADENPNVQWDCKNRVNGNKTESTRAPRNCPSEDWNPRAHIRFPQCWDGVNRDSVNHQSHMAYPVRGSDGIFRCPATHPVPIVLLGMQVTYPPRSVVDMTTAEFSSHGVFSLHADWWNTWRNGANGIDDLTERCLRSGGFCSIQNEPR